MHHLSTLLASILLLASSSVLAIPTGTSSKHHQEQKSPAACSLAPAASSSSAAGANAKAIYFITNDACNSVVALKVADDGTLSDGSVTGTGGAGLSGIESATGDAAGPDSLFSQGAVKVAGNTLVAVNPGSNTMTMFAISSADPTNLTMVGAPVSTLGDFPMSVTLSAALNQACVANSGAQAGVACFAMTASGLKCLDDKLRPFNLGQTTPPKGPFNTVSQTLFNDASTALLTTVKGDPTVNNTGFLSIFPVGKDGKVGRKDLRTSPSGTAVLFGAANVPGQANQLFVTDASFGSATLSLPSVSNSTSNQASILAQTKILDQGATCWAAVSDATGTGFVTDVAVNHLVEVDLASGTLIKELNSTNGNPGLIDLVAKGSFIYALSPGNATVKSAVTVFNVGGGRGTAKEIQNFRPSGVAASAQGMTAF